MIYGVVAQDIGGAGAPPPTPPTKFIAVGTDTDYFASNIQLSPDGTTWTYIRTANLEPDPDTFLGVAPVLLSVCTNGSRWLATGYDDNNVVTYAGLVITSDNDGYNWVAQSHPFASLGAQLQGVCWDGTNFIAVGDDGNVTPRVMTSPDGITWTARTAAPSTGVMWRAVAANSDGSVVVAVGRFTATNGPATMVSSNHGATWASHNGTPINTDYQAIASNEALTGNQFVAVSYADRIMESSNGTTWTQRTGAPSTGIDWLGICWNGSLFVAVGVDTATEAIAKVMTSPDGTTWTARTADSGNAFFRSAAADVDGLVVAVGHNDAFLLPIIQSSPDGTTSWTNRTPDPAFANAGPFFGVAAARTT